MNSSKTILNTKVLLLLSLLVLLSQSSEICGQEIGGPFTIGPTNAPVKIEVFNDYQCPPCGVFNETLKKIRNDYGDAVEIVFRNYPLSGTHLNALRAAQATEAAGLQGKFEEMIELLYKRQIKWAESKHAQSIFLGYANELGLNKDQYVTDTSSESVKARIDRDIERARALEVKGTPTVFVNGKDIPWSQVLDAVQVVLGAKGLATD